MLSIRSKSLSFSPLLATLFGSILCMVGPATAALSDGELGVQSAGRSAASPKTPGRVNSVADSNEVVAAIFAQWKSGDRHSGKCVKLDRGTANFLGFVNKVTDWIGFRSKPVAVSPLAYALGNPTETEVQQRYELLVNAIQSSEPFGRTLHFTPTIDTTDFQAARFVDADDADFWSFKRLAVVAPPQGGNQSPATQHPIDAFINEKLSEHELTQSNPASDTDLLRRLCFDTTGLPPSADLRAKWRDDPSHDNYLKIVEQLLTNSAFGERWSRFWLDLSRYADSDGYEEDDLRPRAFTFRDFATWAMNSDLSYKLFVQWQIAGDQLEPENPMAVAATGFLAGAPVNVFFPQESERMDELDDIVSTMGRAMLGLTVGCARCHDHRYDPIPTQDYYQLVSIFRNTERTHPYLLPDAGREYRSATKAVTEGRGEIMKMLLDSLQEKNIRMLPNFTCEEKDILRMPLDPTNKKQQELLSKCMRCLLVKVEHLSDGSTVLDKFQERYEELTAAIDELAPTMPPPAPTGLAVAGGKAESFFVLENGDLNRRAEEVHPGFLTVLTDSQPEWSHDTWRKWLPDGLDSDEAYPRTALAVWMCDTEHGAGALLARVIVNRIWQEYFGRGIVLTSSDFGMEGANPTHPELLDWLANELVVNDWSLRHIHRLILTSQAYRQSCDNRPDYAAADQQNIWFWRQNRKRLTAEMLRDSLLTVGGNLNRRMYGPGIMPSIPRAAVLNQQKSVRDTWPMLGADDPKAFRRSLYIVSKRSMAVPMMKLFDAPDGSVSCEKRTTTTVPTQALALWNSDFVRRQSRRVATQIETELAAKAEELKKAGMLTIGTCIVKAYRHVLLRDPTPQELTQCESFVSELDPDAKKTGLATLCHVLMLTNEFAYLN